MGNTTTRRAAWPVASGRAGVQPDRQDMAKAATTADWEDPSLAHHATGAALSVISRGLYADHLNGLVAKGEPKDYPVVTSTDSSVNPTTVMISDCGDSSHWLQYRKDTGKLADNVPGGRRSITAEAVGSC